MLTSLIARVIYPPYPPPPNVRNLSLPRQPCPPPTLEYISLREPFLIQCLRDKEINSTVRFGCARQSDD